MQRNFRLPLYRSFLQICINFIQLNAFLLLTIIRVNAIDPSLKNGSGASNTFTAQLMHFQDIKLTNGHTVSSR